MYILFEAQLFNGVSRMLYDLTISGESNMATSKPDVPISMLVDKFGTTFQRLHHVCNVCYRSRVLGIWNYIYVMK